MFDSNPAAVSDKPTSAATSLLPQKKGSNGLPFLSLGSGGCVLFLLLGLLIGSGILLVSCTSTAPVDDEATVAEADVATQEMELQESGTADKRIENESVANHAGAEKAGNQAGQTSNLGTPEISPLTFTLDVTDKREPVEPGFSFEAGITQIHAIFEYANLSPDYIWKQVWYHNGDEVLSTSQPWLENANGIYDYVIEAGGEPLPIGQWALELYMNDGLLTAGSFMIESTDEISATDELPDLADIPKVYKLAYTKWNGEKHDLYVGDSNGNQEQFILSRVAGPSWSGDGRYIFFYGEEGVDQQVINGTLFPLPGVTNGIARLNAAPLPTNISQIRLFQGHGWNDGTARWANVSPDGTMIAYDGDRGGGRRIYFLGTDANQQFRFEIIGEQADWSPDSQKIVYRSGRNNQTGIWISNRNDSGHIRITADGTDSFPSWSPDGKTIAFSREVGGNVDIYTVNVDGSNLDRLTDAPGHDTLPEYTPDGSIIFRSARTGGWSIWKMDGDGSNQIQIVQNAPVGPEWSFSRMSVLR